MKKLFSAVLAALMALSCFVYVPSLSVITNAEINTDVKNTAKIEQAENGAHLSSGEITLTYDKTTFQNPVAAGPDPFVFKDTDGTYYMYATNAPNTGYYGYTSRDLVNWSSIGYVLKASDVTLSEGYEAKNFWAPEIVKLGDRYVMAVSVNEYLVFAYADSPAGPFKTEADATPVFDYTAIDGSFLVEGDALYFYYAKVGYDDTLGKNANVIWGCQIDTQTMRPISETNVKLIYPRSDISWERSSVAEGPTILKHNGTYYLMYTCQGYTSKNYAVGVATSSSPLGNFTRQSNNPVLRGNDAAGIVGTGHNSYTTSPDGTELWMVYHKHAGLNEVHTREVCIDKMSFDSQGRLTVAAEQQEGVPTAGLQSYPSGAISTLKDAKLDSNFSALLSLPTVYVHMSDGSDLGAGTKASPFKSVERAYEALMPNGGSIVFLSSHDFTESRSPESQNETNPGIFITPEGMTGPVMWRGVNAGIRISFNHISFSSDHYIDTLMLMSSSQASTIECKFNNVTFGENLSVLPCYSAGNDAGRYPFIIGGYNQYGMGTGEGDEYLLESPYKHMLQSERPYSVVSTSEDYKITVLGGTWRSVMGGNLRARNDASVGLIDANVTLTLGGNCVVHPLYSNSGELNYAISATGNSALSKKGTATLNITGGEYNVPIYVNGKIGTIETADGVEHATERHHGDSFFNVSGGKINSSVIGGTKRESVASVTQDSLYGVEGNFTLTITDASVFTSSAPYFYMTNGAMTVTGKRTAYVEYPAFNLAKASGMFDEILVIGSNEVSSDRTVFVKQGASGDGLSAASPIGSISDAYRLLGYKGGKIVIMGDFKLSGHYTEPLYHTGTITITQKYGDTVYNGSFSTGGSGRRFILNGPTKFENMSFSTTNSAGLLLIANYYHVEIGEGVTCSGFNSNLIANAFTILGGFQSGVTSTYTPDDADAHITVRSGSGILIVGMNRQIDSDHTRDTYIEIYGGEIGRIYGGNANNSGKSNTGGNVSAKIAGGTFVNSLDFGYYVGGTVTLNLTGGDFSKCTALIGKSGSATATVADSMMTAVASIISEFDIAGQDYDVVFLKDGGTGDGKSASSPVGTFAEAYEKLGGNGGTIVVCGAVALTGNITEPAHNGLVTITQVWDGVDYRSSGVISTNGAGRVYYLNGPAKFENITFTTTNKNVMLFVAQYNPIEIGEGVSTSGFDASTAAKGFTVIGGKNTTTTPISEGTGDAHIIIRSGSEIAVAGLNRYSATNERHAKIEIYGGEIGKIYGGNINGGTGGSVEIIIRGGTFTEAIDCGYGLTGNVSLTVSGGDFSSCPSVVGKSGAASCILYSNVENALRPILSKFDNITVYSKVVYLKDGGTGDGSTTDKPLGSLADAYAELGNGGGHIVICGTYTLTGTFIAPKHTGKVTITQKSADGDFTSEGSLYTGGTGRRIEAGGPTVFENINITTKNNGGLIIVGHYHTLELGEGVTASGFTSSEVAKALSLIGGRNSGVISEYEGTGDAHIIVRSGKGILVAGLNRYTSADHDRSALIEIYGGTVGKIYGGNINGGSGGNSEIKIYGGTFTNVIDCGMGVGGKVKLYIEDGNFSACSSVTGLSGKATADIYNKYEYSLVPKMSKFDSIKLLSATVYVLSGATGDGSSPDSPINTLTEAYKLLGDNGGTIVFVGDFNMGADFAEPSHTGKVVLTMNYNDIDYRDKAAFSTNGAGRKWTMNGPLVIENIDFVTNSTSHYLFLVAQYNRIELAEGVSCTGFGGTLVNNSFTILGGMNSGSDTGTGSSHIIVRSGSGIYIAGMNRYISTAHQNNAKIEIYGGTIGSVYGGNINNGTGGNVEMYIYGGTFTQPLNCAYGITGTVALTVSGGNFDACTAIKGNENLNCIATVSEKMENTVVPKLTGFGTITTSTGTTTVLIPEEVFGSGSFTASDGTTLPYRVYYPEGYETSGKTYPIFVYFHGNGSRGDDNKLQLGANHALVTKVLNCGTEAVIVAPQCPKTSAWVSTYPGDAGFDPEKAPESVHLSAAIELINSFLADSRIDSERLYLGGGSNGGAACWSIISRNPDMVAGAIIQAGTGSSAAPETVAQNCLTTPIWTFHGDSDTTLNVAGTRSIVNAIKALGGTNITYTEMPGYNHNIWVDAANVPGLYDWLFSKTREGASGVLSNVYKEYVPVDGDVDRDGVLTNSDVTLLVRYLSGFDVTIDTENADITSDGKINNRDAVMIVQSIVGWFEE